MNGTSAEHVRTICPACGNVADTYRERGELLIVPHRDTANWPAWCSQGGKAVKG